MCIAQIQKRLSTFDLSSRLNTVHPLQREIAKAIRPLAGIASSAVEVKARKAS